MTQQTYTGGPDGPGPRPAGDLPATEVARDQAGQVGRSAADAGRHVAGTAKDEAGEVVRETRRQAADLLDQARQQATDQVRGGQQQAAQGLRSLASELNRMAGSAERGPLSDLTEQAADRVDHVAGWLERREPGDLVEEVRRLARRRPGAFLVGAAIAGVLAGRLTRGAVDARRDTGSDRTDPSIPRPYGTQPAYASPLPPGDATLPPTPPLGTPAPPLPPPGTAAPGGGPGPYPGGYPDAAPPVTGGPGGYPDAVPGAGVPPYREGTVGEYVEDVRRGGPGGPL